MNVNKGSLDELNYVFNYTDHLGNVRVTYGVDPSSYELKIMEENNYYPFGLKHANYNMDKINYEEMLSGGSIGMVPVESIPFKYKYNGKELQDELGLNMYDYGARLYDPARAGWSNIDPKAEVSRRWSPYNYCYNNPLRFIDPDGMMAFDPGDKFKTMKAAAHDFLKLYNGISIMNKVELKTAFYKSKDGSYSYTVPEGKIETKDPNSGNTAGTPVDDVGKGNVKTGDGHTHSNDDKEGNYNKLGPGDSQTAFNQAKDSKNPSEYRMYIGTPDGSGLEKDPYVEGKEPEANSKNPNIQVFATDIPSDPKSDEPRQNQISPDTYTPKIMPVIKRDGTPIPNSEIKTKYKS